MYSYKRMILHEQKEEFWKNFDQIDIDIARIKGF